MVTGSPNVRFYAGHPIHGPTGLPVGALSIVDTAPRDGSQIDMGILERLAKMVEHQFELTDVISTQRALIETKSQLLVTQDQLRRELQDAADYVRSLLPAPNLEGKVHVDWAFESSSTLGGDIFGYEWVDDDCFIAFLVDVAGHGVGSALLASSVQSALRRKTLPGVDFLDPASVLAGLNHAFPMEKHGSKFFTVWYGVYHPSTRTLSYVSAGHPPAILISADGMSRNLEASAMVVGVMEEESYESISTTVEPESRLFLFTDGTFESKNLDGEFLGMPKFEEQIRANLNSVCPVSGIKRQLEEWQGHASFEDDLSLLQFRFID